MDKLAQDRMMGALKTGKKPKKLALDPEDMKEMAKLVNEPSAVMR